MASVETLSHAKAPIYITSSQKIGTSEPINYPWTPCKREASEFMANLALDTWKELKGIPKAVTVRSPLFDTIALEDITSGIHMRYRDDTLDIIDIYNIRKVETGIVFSSKKREQVVIHTFKIHKIERINSSS